MEQQYYPSRKTLPSFKEFMQNDNLLKHAQL